MPPKRPGRVHLVATQASTRLAKNRRGGFSRVVLSDASVAGEGELKCLEYFCRADIPWTGRGTAAAGDVDSPWRSDAAAAKS